MVVLALKVYRTPHYTTRSLWDGTRLVKIGHTRENTRTNAKVYSFSASRDSGFAIPLETAA